MTAISEAVQKLCGGKGSRSAFSVKGAASASTSKAVSLVVDGKVTGEATFTKEEWDGVRAVQDDAAGYSACVQKLTPTFIDKFAATNVTLLQPDVTQLDLRLGIKDLRDYCAANPGVPPPVTLLNPPQQVRCRNGTADASRPVCICP
jgi:hypothetical protein